MKRHCFPLRSLLGRALFVGLIGALAGCSVGRETLNAQVPVLETSAEDSLTRGDLAAAEEIARDLERRIPGVDTYALYGRVLWRTGRLIEAEAYHRRASVDGLAEGLLGQARAEVAEGELDAAAERLERLIEVPRVAERAERLRASIALAGGNGLEAAARFQAASEAGATPEPDRAIASALRGVATRYGLWEGEPATLAIDSAAIVEATLDGTPVRARVDLLASRSTVAGRLVGSADVSVRSARVGLGGLETAAILAVEDLPDSVDLRIGFDLLSGIRWSLDVDAGRFAVAPPAGDLPEPLDLPRTHWTSARVPRDGLAVQLLVFPRIDGYARSAALDAAGPTRVDQRLIDGSGDDPDQRTVEVEIRLGAWRQDVTVGIVDLYGLGAGGGIAPRIVLGRDLLSGWRVRWTPGRPELALERSE